MDRAVPLYRRSEIQIFLIFQKSNFYALGALSRIKIRKDVFGVITRNTGPFSIILQVLHLKWIFSDFNLIHVKDYFIYSPE
jgi:hypothetical protein